MKKSQHLHGTNPLTSDKGTIKNRHRKPEMINSFQSSVDKVASNTVNLSDPDRETETAYNAKLVLDFLGSEGHTAKLQSLSKWVPFYQLCFDYALPRDITAKWVPGLGVDGTELDIIVDLHGQTAHIHASLNTTSIPSDHETGRYYIEVRNFQEFHQWYILTFGEGQL